jgi:hypothetical protein
MTAGESSIDLKTEVGEPLVRLRADMMRNAASTEVLPVAVTVLAETPWLVMLAWYLMVLVFIDAGLQRW